MAQGRAAGVLAGAAAVLAMSVAAGALAGPSAKSDPRDARGPLDLARVSLEQGLHNLVLEVRTRGGWDLGALTKYPRSPQARGQRFLCLVLSSPRSRPQQLCAGAKRGELGRSLLVDGGASRKGAIPARVSRPTRNRLRAAFRPAAAGLEPGTFRWHLASGWSGPACTSNGPVREPPSAPGESSDLCLDRAPDGEGSFRGRVFEVRPVGCTRKGPNVVTNGPRTEKVAALTFDDGPSGYTARILAILDQRHAKGTFFEIGALVASRAGLMRQAVERGHEVANHSYRHSYYPSSGDMGATSAAIRRATGFTPCSFRPPGRLFNGATVSAADRNGMTTVLWDVDPQDWQLPGSGAIYSRVVRATRPGSIVILHDGGGNRAQTVAALPRIISTLRSRGYRLTTVSRVLGGRPIYAKVR